MNFQPQTRVPLILKGCHQQRVAPKPTTSDSGQPHCRHDQLGRYAGTFGVKDQQVNTDLAPGLYYLRVQLSDGTFKSLKHVIR